MRERYVVFLRGVTPMNARMAELKRCFEAAGFTNVRTLLTSGNVVFDARAVTIDGLQRKAEVAMAAALTRPFAAFVRSQSYLKGLLEADPFAAYRVPRSAKRVITFLRRPAAPATVLPPSRRGARILKIQGQEIFSVYVTGPKGPVFMALLERTFGTDITTRTWGTVRKCASA